MAAFREISQDLAGVAAFLRTGCHLFFFFWVDQKQNKECHCRLSPVSICLTADRHRAMILSPVFFPNTERTNLKLHIPDWTTNSHL